MWEIRELGRYLQERENLEPFQILITRDKNIAGVLSIIIANDGKTFTYAGIDYREYQNQEIYRYLYSRGTSRGTNITLAAIITDNVKKTFENKILNWFGKDFKNFANKEKLPISLSDDDYNLLKGLYGVLVDEKSTIIKDLDAKYKEVYASVVKERKERKDSTKPSFLMTVLLKMPDGLAHFIGELPFMRKWLVAQKKRTIFFKYKTESRGIGTCYLCKKTNVEVYGFMTTFPFYTLDKRVFSPHMNIEDGWKQFSVCSDCYVYIERAKDYLDEYLTFRFYGHRYYLIPKFLLPPSDELVMDVFDVFEYRAKQAKKEVEIKVKADIKELQKLTDDEDEILELLAEEPNQLALTLLFFQQPNKGQMNVELIIPEVLPSRLKKLFDAKTAVDQRNEVHLLGEENDKFSFGFVRRVFPSEFDKTFLEVTKKIFVGKPISFNFVISHAIRSIRNSIFDANGKVSIFKIRDATIKAWITMQFLYQLKILEFNTPIENIKKIEGGDLILSTKEEYKDFEEKITQYLEQNAAFFNTSAKKGIFLLGVLAGNLLYHQRSERKSMPFWSKLNGLRLDEKRTKALLPKIINKLEEYEKNYPTYQILEKMISKYFIEAGEQWKLSPDQISFYFSLGLSLSSEFSFKTENDAEESSNEEDTDSSSSNLEKFM